MTKPASLLLLFFGLTCSARAEDLPTIELFGGYSFVRLDVPEDITAPAALIPDLNLHGWRAAFTANFGNNFGLMVDGSGHYGTTSLLAVPVDATAYTLLVGPRFATRHRRLTFFVNGLVGAAYARADAPGE